MKNKNFSTFFFLNNPNDVMKRANIQSATLLLAGMVVMGVSFALEHYFTVNDFSNGLLKGVGVGLALLSIFIRTHKTSSASASL